MRQWSMTTFLVFGAIAGIIALFFVADWVWAGRLKKKLRTDASKRPASGAYDPARNSSANYGATLNQGGHGVQGSGGFAG